MAFAPLSSCGYGGLNGLVQQSEVSQVNVRGFVAAVMVAVAGMAGLAQSAGAVPSPKAANGNKVRVFATGVALPVQMAFKGNTAFIAGGAEENIKGGLYYVRPGSKKAKRVPGTPPVSFGVAWHHGHLYANFGNVIRIFSGWTGSKFRQSRILVRFNQKRFTNFTGLAFGPNGRLYTGVGLQFDSKASKLPYANSVISIDRHRGSIRTVSTGMRQPWQLTFVKGLKSPFVSNLSQETPTGTKARDYIAHATPGANFGFPKCDWSNVSTCVAQGFKKPAIVFKHEEKPTPSPMGITAKGKRLFVALFNGRETPEGPQPEVISTTVDGSKMSTAVSGFLAPVLLANYHGGYLYMGDFTGTVWRVKA